MVMDVLKVDLTSHCNIYIHGGVLNCISREYLWCDLGGRYIYYILIYTDHKGIMSE